jgi:hypothetical protein
LLRREGKKKFLLRREGKKKKFDVALFKTSKKLIINFFGVLIFATSKNFDMAFLTKVLKRQKVLFFL